MSFCQAILLQVAVVLVAVDVGFVHQRLGCAASEADVCPEWRQTICSICSSSSSSSVDAENGCCSDDLTYGLCVDRLVRLSSVSREIDSRMSQNNKRAKYFLGKRVKYFLGKRRGGAPSASEEDEEGLTGFHRNQIREEEKRAKYFLGK